MPKTTPCLWFDFKGEEAASFYTSIFPNSRILEAVPYPPGAPGPEGAAMTVTFELDGQRFVALNGGPQFSFTEAVSFQVDCATQDEVDRYWSKLSEGGEEGPCGWLKDRYGLSWQIVPDRLIELLSSSDPATSGRVMAAVMGMGKIDIAAVERAAEAG